MKRSILLAVSLLVFLPLICFGQVPVPAPVADREMRDSSSIRRRSLELERVKREADAPVLTEDGRKINFAEVKKDFEKIQKLQSSIVRAYTTGKTIGYREISKYAAELNKCSLRLKVNLFPASVKRSEIQKETQEETKIPNSVKQLIVDLDDQIGSFTVSPMFQNLRLIDPAVYEKAGLELNRIIRLSFALDQLAEQMAGSGN